MVMPEKRLRLRGIWRRDQRYRIEEVSAAPATAASLSA
jgi:hypothetical protein